MIMFYIWAYQAVFQYKTAMRLTATVLLTCLSTRINQNAVQTNIDNEQQSSHHRFNVLSLVIRIVFQHFIQ